jgi:hypothetical protein
MFWILAAFFFAADILYTVWHLIEFNTAGESAQAPQTPVEWVGTVAIGLAAAFGGLIAFYVSLTRRGQGGELPEDRIDAEIDDGDPEVGYFSPWSWWPMLLAFGTALAFLGFAVGIWITFIGVPIALLAVIGWYYEYYRNYFAR